MSRIRFLGSSFSLVLILYASEVAAVTNFLSLPFSDAPIVVTTGWYYKDGSNHKGIDYRLSQDHPVLAAADGVAMTSVQLISGKESYGTFVFINHQNGYSTLYSHLNSVQSNILALDFEKDNVRSNKNFLLWTKVKKGDVIGFVGESGTNGGVHLHFEVAENSLGTYEDHVGSKIDPYNINDLTSFYPPSGTNYTDCGKNFLWTECPPSLPPSTTFAIGDRVVTTANLNARSAPSLSSTTVGVQPTDSQGTVIGGPVFADGLWWWQVDFDTGPDGWVAENFLEIPPPPEPGPTASHNLIAFVTLSPSKICVVHADTKTTKCLTAPPQSAQDSVPSWSPDGTKIAFERRFFDGRAVDASIFAVDFDGTNLINLSGDVLNAGSNVHWSPDGSHISFLTGILTSNGIVSGVVITAADGSSQTVLNATASCQSDAPWSPDGVTLAAACLPTFLPQGIYLFNQDGTNFRLLIAISHLIIRNIRWSPQGDRLLFIRTTLNATATGIQATELWVVNADGSNPIRLYSSPIPNSNFQAAEWSPDGSRIVFDAPPTINKGGDIFTVNPDGTNLTNIESVNPFV